MKLRLIVLILRLISTSFINKHHETPLQLIDFKYLWIKPTNQVFMKNHFFKTLSKINQKVLPSYTKKRLDLQKASKIQLAVFGWKLWVTKKALD